METKDFAKIMEDLKFKFNLYCFNHSCKEDCELLNLVGINQPCILMLIDKPGELSEKLLAWYDNFKKTNTMAYNFKEWVKAYTNYEYPWKDFSLDCGMNCSEEIPCNDCSWWDHLLIDTEQLTKLVKNKKEVPIEL